MEFNGKKIPSNQPIYEIVLGLAIVVSFNVKVKSIAFTSAIIVISFLIDLILSISKKRLQKENNPNYFTHLLIGIGITILYIAALNLYIWYILSKNII